MGTAPSAIQELSDLAHAQPTFGSQTRFGLPNGHQLYVSLSCPVVTRPGANAYVQLSETDGNRYASRPDEYAADMAEAVRKVAALTRRRPAPTDVVYLSLTTRPTIAKKPDPRTPGDVLREPAEVCIVERAIVTLASERALLLIGEPGPARAG